MLNPSLYPFSQPELNITTLPETQLEMAARLFPAEAEALFKRLIQENWSRLSSEYDDPLGMLFGNRAKQWTVGWDTQTQALYLLVWETDSWQEKPIWSLYQDGQLIFQEEDGFSQNRSQLLHQLLESEQLPLLGYSQLLAPLIDYRYFQEQRQQAAQSLLSTILTRPELFSSFKESLFQTLEADLGNPEWPLLEILKVHRLAHKIPLVALFQQFVKAGLIRTAKDSARLDEALTRLQQDFAEHGPKISMLFQSAYLQAYNEFRRIITTGTWRIQLRLILAEATPAAFETSS